ncbi:MAG: lipid A biosynthesis acyltransferase, partial [Bdellovibrionales bacterium]
TQVFTDKIEQVVRKYPDQWMWVHRRWKWKGP